MVGLTTDSDTVTKNAFFVEKSTLIGILARQNSVVERRTITPVHSHVLCEVDYDTGSLHITGTDKDIRLVEKCTIHMAQSTLHKNQDAFTVPAHFLHEIIRKLPGERILFSYEEHLLVSAGDSCFTVPTLPASGFPAFEPPHLSTTVQVRTQTLKHMIESIKMCIAVNDTRPTLNGIYFHPADNMWRAVSTDGYRLGMCAIPAEDLLHLPPVIIGRKTLAEIIKLTESFEGTVTMSLSHTHIQLCFPHATFSARVIAGEFPQYEQVIPKNHPHHAIVQVSQLADAIARVGLVNTEKQHSIKATFASNDLTLYAHSTQYGSAVETIPITLIVEKPLHIHFNARHILDVCRVFKHEKIHITFRDNHAPVLFHDPDEPRMAYILMPTLAS